MSHFVLIKHGYGLVVETKKMRVYEGHEKQIVVWKSGNVRVYDG